MRLCSFVTLRLYGLPTLHLLHLLHFAPSHFPPHLLLPSDLSAPRSRTKLITPCHGDAAQYNCVPTSRETPTSLRQWSAAHTFAKSFRDFNTRWR